MADAYKKAIMTQEFASEIETGNVFSKFATYIVASAKNIVSPYITVSDAKKHAQSCSTPIGTSTKGVDELVLTRAVGNAVLDCETELSWDNYDSTGLIRSALYKSVNKKHSAVVVDEIQADATSGTCDLSTAEKVKTFLITVAAEAAQDATFGVNQTIDGGTTKRAQYHGRPFVAAGTSAYVQIISAVQGVLALSSTRGIDGEVVETPYGVLVVNLGTAADADEVVWGVAGAPTIAVRNDKLEVEMGRMTAETTLAANDSLGEVDAGDAILKQTWYARAQFRGKAGVFTNVASLVKKADATLPA